ncbi:MAG: tRNA uridine(34) 5-carboxymethylaminomethyl modification radical SAM/GNAT enzyme Elp3 [Candidatus Lokiarchaeota archaeon]|nr:tRNA uridine(34) 5-carboxymethylaminomethyl modification radical SAM/GNAT enzyme Elp3 [Candidatus Lokiarchaeota archaeon]
MSQVNDINKVKQIARATIDYIINHPNINKSKITNVKAKFAKKFSFNGVIKNATILEMATKEERKVITQILKRRKTRTLSGVSVIAIMTKPLPCPGGCIFCPGKESQPEHHAAQSYTGKEPAAMRSIYCNYDPYEQVKCRISDLEAIGHNVDKIELILMGGTLLSADLKYQKQFVQGAIEGVLDKRVETLEEGKFLAEKSKRRIVGITVETRPDFCKERDIDLMLSYGTTRVEIGVQTIYDDIYHIVQRGHTTIDSIEAIRIAKDAGLKINAHLMPNLPGSSYERDIETFNTIFTNPNYKPDMLKIYPCLVIKGTRLWELWKNDEYKPYSVDELVNLLAEVKQNIPSYMRVQRIMRDIPATLIEAGCKNSNLRQLVLERLKEQQKKCNCIRCREYGVGNRKIESNNINFENIELYRQEYEASQGQEIFLSYENKIEGYLLGYLRLRKPSERAHRKELNDGKTSIVREIKIVGELVPKNAKASRATQIQHRGYGRLLMENAEKLSKEVFDSKKIAVISGIGVRDWFYEQNYKPDGPYVSKRI